MRKWRSRSRKTTTFFSSFFFLAACAGSVETTRSVKEVSGRVLKYERTARAMSIVGARNSSPAARCIWTYWLSRESIPDCL